MKTTKIGAIFVISVMALAGSGAAYAMWWDSLHLDIMVSTGTVGAIWSYDSWSSNEDKYISDINVYMNDDMDVMSIYMSDVYPCITYKIFFNIECTGTIPIHVEPLEFNTNLIPANGGTIDVYIADAAGGYVLWPTTGYIQLHQGDIRYGYFEIHFDNDLQQGLDNVLMVCADFVYHQYNEAWP